MPSRDLSPPLQVDTLIKQKLPEHVRLQDIVYGRRTRLELFDGFVALPARALAAEPSCVELSADEKRYDFVVKVKHCLIYVIFQLLFACCPQLVARS